ncbi:MAG: nucleoside hydrolase, partial [Tuberibacillus sp.]
ADLKEEATSIHGEDGLGNTSFPDPSVSKIDQHAVDFLVEKIRQHPHEVTVIAVAAMTNVAMAVMKDPEIVNLVDQIVIMGGAVTVPGNVTPYAEANIMADPEAAEFLFRSGAPITLVGLDVTMQTLLHRDYVDAWRKQNTRISTFMADITEFYMDAYLSFYPDILGCALHDPLAVGVVIDPSFVKTKAMHVQVDTDGEISKGRTIGDLRGKPAHAPNMNVCLEVDTDRFVTHFVGRVTGA